MTKLISPEILSLQSEMSRKMRRWSVSKLAKELAFRDDNGGSIEGIAWCQALEAERDRRFGS